MNLTYKRSVTILREKEKNQWGEVIYGGSILFENVELTYQPLFLTENGKRVIKQCATLTIYEPLQHASPLKKEDWLNARVIDEAHNIMYVNEFSRINDREGKPIKYQLNLIERSD